MLRATSLVCLSVLGLSALAFAPPAFCADAPAADKAAPAAPAAKGVFSLDRIHKELCRDIKLDRTQARAMRQMRIDDSKKYDAFKKEHKAEFRAFEKSDDLWKKENKPAIEEAKKAVRSARKGGEAAAIAQAEAAYDKLLDSRPKLPAALERETFTPEQIIPTVKALMHEDQMKEFEINIKALKRMQEKIEAEKK